MAKIIFKSAGITTEATKKNTGNPNIGNAERNQRGKIKTFSSASRKRLRQKIMDLHPPAGWLTYSLTLTIPGEVIPDEKSNKMFRLWSESKMQRCRYACIWRKEIQARGQTHWHLLFFCDTSSIAYRAVSAWWAVLGERADLPGARIRSAVVTPVTDTSLYARYMQDHLSKLKSGQVAHEKRHWGIINRKYLSDNNALLHDVYNINDGVFMRYLRVQRRLFCPFKRKQKSKSGYGKNGNSGYKNEFVFCPFGYKLGFKNKRGWQGRSDFFSETSKRTALKRWLDFLMVGLVYSPFEDWQPISENLNSESEFFEDLEISKRIQDGIKKGLHKLDHDFSEKTY